MRANDHLEKAHRLVRLGDEDHAEACFSDAIDAALAERDEVLLARSRLGLAELLHRQGRADEALIFLRQVVRTEIPDGSVLAEVKRAAAVMREIFGVEE